MCDISVGMTDNKDKNKAEILLLSVAANIVSRHTSMVGVDKDRKEKIVGEMIQRDVPLMTSRGMMRFQRPLMTSRGMMRFQCAPMAMVSNSVSNCITL